MFLNSILPHSISKIVGSRGKKNTTTNKSFNLYAPVNNKISGKGPSLDVGKMVSSDFGIGFNPNKTIIADAVSSVVGSGRVSKFTNVLNRTFGININSSGNSIFSETNVNAARLADNQFIQNMLFGSSSPFVPSTDQEQQGYRTYGNGAIAHVPDTIYNRPNSLNSISNDNQYKVRLVSVLSTLVSNSAESIAGNSVIFDTSPRVSEGLSVEYTNLMPVHMPNGIMAYRNTRARTFTISVALVSRSAREAADNMVKLQILRSWTKPFFGRFGNSSLKSIALRDVPFNTEYSNATETIKAKSTNVSKISKSTKSFDIERIVKNSMVLANSTTTYTTNGSLSNKAYPKVDNTRKILAAKDIASSSEYQKHYFNNEKSNPEKSGTNKSKLSRKGSTVEESRITAGSPDVSTVIRSDRIDDKALLAQYGAKAGKPNTNKITDKLGNVIVAKPKAENIPTDNRGNQVGTTAATAPAPLDTNALTPASLRGAPPEILYLYAYSNDIKSVHSNFDRVNVEDGRINLNKIPVVITNLSIDYPEDCDFIPVSLDTDTKSGRIEPFPRYLTLNINLTESQSPADIEQFDLYRYKIGQLAYN